MHSSGNTHTLRSGRMLGNSEIVLTENSDQLRGATGQTNDSTRPKTTHLGLGLHLDEQERYESNTNSLDRTETGEGDVLDPPQDQPKSPRPNLTETTSVMDRYLLDKLAEVLADDKSTRQQPATNSANGRANNFHFGPTRPSQDHNDRNGMGFQASPLPPNRVHRLRPERAFELSRDTNRMPISDHTHFLNESGTEPIHVHQRRTHNLRPTTWPQTQQTNHGPTPSNLPTVKTPQYDGTSSWPDYLVQFEMVAELNDWDDYAMAMSLATNLRGTAQSVLGDLNDHERHDYESLVACLNQRFGPEHQTEMFRAILHNRTRQPEETLPDLAHEIRKLVRLAYPTGERVIIETIALEHFINALSEPDTKWRIQQTRPQTLDQAVRIAVELEAFQTANRQKSNKKDVRSVTASNNDGNQEIESMVTRMQKLMTEGLQALERNVNGFKRNKRCPQDRNQWTEVTCYHCDQPGHKRNTCPKLTGTTL